MMTWSLITFLAIVAGMGILQFHGYDITGSGMLWSADKGIWQIRGAGIFDNPNDLAYSVILVVPFVLGFLVGKSSFLTKAISAFLLAIVVYCVYLTGSRGGYLCLVVSGLFWLYFWIDSKLVRRIAAAVGIVVILLALGAQAGGYRDDKSSMDRIEAWAAGMDMLKSHPLIGVGKGQFGEYHKRDSHSSFVRCAAELGLMGLYAWLGAVYCSVISLLRLRKGQGPPEWKAYVAGFGVYIPGYLCASVFSSRTYDIVFLLAIAMISAFERLASSAAPNGAQAVLPKPIKMFNKNVAILTVGVIVALKLFIMQVW